MPWPDPEWRRAAVERIGQLREAGELTTEHVRLAASGLGVRERTVWRWLSLADGQPGAPDRRVRYQLSEADREAYARYRGNVAAVHRARVAVLASPDAPVVVAAGVPVPASLRDGWRGAPPVTERTLQRAFRRELTAAEAAAWAEGEEGQRAAGVYLTRPAGHRNQTWEMDHKQLPILVMPPRGAACCPWLTTVIDDATRVLAGWAIALTPHTGTVLTAVRMALAHDPARGPFGAIPDQVRIDRGLEFAAEAVRDRVRRLEHRPAADVGVPHRKGKVERVHRTIDQTLLCGLPGFTGGPRDASGRLYGPLDDRFTARLRAAGDPVTPMMIEAFAGLVAQWADWYNTERPHDGLDGRTPRQAWQDDPGPLHRISPDRLRHLLLNSGERIIGKDGIRFNNLAYIARRRCTAAAGSGCRSGTCRTMTAASRSTSAARTCAPPTRRSGCRRSRPGRSWRTPPANAKRLTAERRKASARARAELAPLTGSESRAEESRGLPPRAGDELAARRGDALLRRKARSNLLGLTDPTQPPQAEQES